jgi:hypothetical protein
MAAIDYLPIQFPVFDGSFLWDCITYICLRVASFVKLFLCLMIWLEDPMRDQSDREVNAIHMQIACRAPNNSQNYIALPPGNSRRQGRLALLFDLPPSGT